MGLPELPSVERLKTNKSDGHLQNHRGGPVGEGQLLVQADSAPSVPMSGTTGTSDRGNSKYPKYFGKKYFKEKNFFVFHRTSSQVGETTG